MLKISCKAAGPCGVRWSLSTRSAVWETPFALHIKSFSPLIIHKYWLYIFQETPGKCCHVIELDVREKKGIHTESKHMKVRQFYIVYFLVCPCCKCTENKYDESAMWAWLRGCLLIQVSECVCVCVRGYFKHGWSQGSILLIKKGQNTLPKSTAVLIHLLLIFPCHLDFFFFFSFHSHYHLSLALFLLSVW